MEPLHREIRQRFPAAEFNKQPKFIETMFYERAKHEITNEDIRATILSGPGWNPVLLAIGIAIRTRVSGHLEFGGMYYLGRTKTMGGHIDSWKSERHMVLCGSIVLEERLSTLASDMQAMFPSWLEQFTAALDSSTS